MAIRGVDDEKNKSFIKAMQESRRTNNDSLLGNSQLRALPSLDLITKSPNRTSYDEADPTTVDASRLIEAANRASKKL